MFLQRLRGFLLRLCGGARAEQVIEMLRQFGRDEIQGALQLVTLERAVGGSKLLIGCLIGDILKDGKGTDAMPP